MSVLMFFFITFITSTTILGWIVSGSFFLAKGVDVSSLDILIGEKRKISSDTEEALNFFIVIFSFLCPPLYWGIALVRGITSGIIWLCANFVKHSKVILDIPKKSEEKVENKGVRQHFNNNNIMEYFND